MRIFAIRHGQTHWNEAGKVQGRTDNPLTNKGREQAYLAGKNLKSTDAHIDIIYSSPLAMAKETAAIIATIIGCENIIVDERLIERDFGIYEGEPILSVDIDALRRWNDFAPTPKGETMKEVANRVFGFLDEAVSKSQGKDILLAAHGHILRPVIWYFNDFPEKGNETVIKTDCCEFYEFEK
jgi:broad specificity phosphatase PhoE